MPTHNLTNAMLCFTWDRACVFTLRAITLNTSSNLQLGKTEIAAAIPATPGGNEMAT